MEQTTARPARGQWTRPWPVRAPRRDARV